MRNFFFTLINKLNGLVFLWKTNKSSLEMRLKLNVIWIFPSSALSFRIPRPFDATADGFRRLAVYFRSFQQGIHGIGEIWLTH